MQDQNNGDSIYIKKDKLKLLLEQKKQHINSSITEGIELIISGVTIIVTDMISDLKNNFIPEYIIKIILLLFALYFIVRGVYSIMTHTKYNHKTLYNDISNLSTITHPFSIVAIKDTFNRYPNRYLLYYDTRWDCDFFPNFPTRSSEQANKENIINQISNTLKIDPSKITLEYKCTQIYEKYSVSDKYEKTYEHKLFVANISEFPDDEHNDTFVIEDKKFKWLTLSQMSEDKNIQEKNMDVVSLVSRNI